MRTSIAVVTSEAAAALTEISSVIVATRSSVSARIGRAFLYVCEHTHKQCNVEAKHYNSKGFAVTLPTIPHGFVF